MEFNQKLVNAFHQASQEFVGMVVRWVYSVQPCKYRMVVCSKLLDWHLEMR